MWCAVVFSCKAHMQHVICSISDTWASSWHDRLHMFWDLVSVLYNDAPCLRTTNYRLHMFWDLYYSVSSYVTVLQHLDTEYQFFQGPQTWMFTYGRCQGLSHSTAEWKSHHLHLKRIIVLPLSHRVNISSTTVVARWAPIPSQSCHHWPNIYNYPIGGRVGVLTEHYGIGSRILVL